MCDQNLVKVQSRNQGQAIQGLVSCVADYERSPEGCRNHEPPAQGRRMGGVDYEIDFTKRVVVHIFVMPWCKKD